MGGKTTGSSPEASCTYVYMKIEDNVSQHVIIDTIIHIICL